MDKLIDSMIEAVKSTFADMVFMDVSETAEVELTHYSQIIHITVMEPEYLDIVLWLPFEIKKEITETVYGKEWGDISDSEIDDCLLEVLNVLTGNFLVEYVGSDIKYSISIPEVLFDESEIEMKNVRDVFFDAEGKPMRVSIISR